MLKKFLSFIKKVKSDKNQLEKGYDEMREKNKTTMKETRERMKIKQEEFDRKRNSRK